MYKNLLTFIDTRELLGMASVEMTISDTEI